MFADAGNTEIAYTCFVTGFNFDEIAVDGVVTASLTVKITGAVEITP